MLLVILPYYQVSNNEILIWLDLKPACQRIIVFFRRRQIMKYSIYLKTIETFLLDTLVAFFATGPGWVLKCTSF